MFLQKVKFFYLTFKTFFPRFYDCIHLCTVSCNPLFVSTLSLISLVYFSFKTSRVDFVHMDIHLTYNLNYSGHMQETEGDTCNLQLAVPPILNFTF